MFSRSKASAANIGIIAILVHFEKNSIKSCAKITSKLMPMFCLNGTVAAGGGAREGGSGLMASQVMVTWGNHPWTEKMTDTND